MSASGNPAAGSPDPGNILPLTRADLACYAVAMCPEYRVARHHRTLIERLEAVERGEARRVMVFMPPRHGKSLTASCIFPAFYLGRNPGRFYPPLEPLGVLPRCRRA
jgi:hypothetical protein